MYVPKSTEDVSSKQGSETSLSLMEHLGISACRTKSSGYVFGKSATFGRAPAISNVNSSQNTLAQQI